MNKTVIIFSPAGGSTERIAKLMHNQLGTDQCDLFPVKEIGISDLGKYSNIIFGIATIGNETWQSEPAQSGWFTFIHELEKARLGDKTIALFGLGDHIRYPDHFVDAMGELYEALNNLGVETTGKVDPEGYEFNESKALVDGKFVGLPVDEVFQADKTEQRVKDWLEEIKVNFK